MGLRLSLNVAEITLNLYQTLLQTVLYPKCNNKYTSTTVSFPLIMFSLLVLLSCRGQCSSDHVSTHSWFSSINRLLLPPQTKTRSTLMPQRVCVSLKVSVISYVWSQKQPKETKYNDTISTLHPSLCRELLENV